MEQGFQSLLLTGKYGVGDGSFPATASSDETYTNSELSFQTQIYDKSLFPSLKYYPYASSDDAFDGINQSAKTCESSNEYIKWRCVETEEKLKRLKTEPSTESFIFTPTNAFSYLPEIRSMEQVNQEENRLKQKFSPVATTSTNQQMMLESALMNFQLTANGFTPAPLQPLRPPFPPPKTSNGEKTRRRRRQTSSDKTRSLQKLLPVEKKMDIATVYEETYNYIEFLKAQITVLESMHVSSTSSFNFRSENPRYGNLYGGLGKLNRQQLLEILINSPAAQSILYSKGCCIYSLEQLMLFKDIAEKSFFFSDH